MARKVKTGMERQKFGPASGFLTEEQVQRKIRDIAQQLYEKRGRTPGHELDDWLEAERRVRGC